MATRCSTHTQKKLPASKTSINATHTGLRSSRRCQEAEDLEQARKQEVEGDGRDDSRSPRITSFLCSLSPVPVGGHSA